MISTYMPPRELGVAQHQQNGFVPVLTRMQRQTPTAPKELPAFDPADPFKFRHILRTMEGENRHMSDRHAHTWLMNKCGLSMGELMFVCAAEQEHFSLPETKEARRRREALEEESRRVQEIEQRAIAKEQEKASLTTKLPQIDLLLSERITRTEESRDLVRARKAQLAELLLTPDGSDLTVERTKQALLEFLAFEPFLVEGLKTAIETLKAERADIVSRLAKLK